MRLGEWLDDLRSDLRLALRQLGKARWFTVIASLTLALGIGANSAIFALVEATLLRPLPFRDPDRLVMLFERTATATGGRVSPANLVDWNERGRSFEAIGGFVPNVGGMVTRGPDGSPETLSRQWVTAGIFDALGVRAIVGRTFLPSDDEERRNVVVLSEGLWRTRFGADPSLVGRELSLDGVLHTVVGVVPQPAELIGRSSLWKLRPIRDGAGGPRGAHSLQAIGRLKPGVTLQAASADLAAVAAELAREFPTTNLGRGVTLEPLHDVVIGGELRRTSLLFLGVVGFVLLICCANVANLLLARATVRGREFALRAALGAGRGRLLRMLLTESLVLSLIGNALGVAAGVAILDVASSLVPADLLSAAVTLSFNLRVVVFCIAAAVLAGVVFGLAPAWQATELQPAQALASDGRTNTGRGGRVRELLVVGEVATAVILLVGAGLLLRTLLAVENADRGYRAESILTMIVDPRTSEPGPLLQFYDAVEREAMALPGVRGVAWATTLPMGRSYQGRSSFEIVGDPKPAESQRTSADYQIVSPSYFRTLDLPLVAGRGFDDRDRSDGPPVCIVNEAFVRLHLRGRSPLGLRVSFPRQDSAPPVVREIVGVARQVKGRPDEAREFVQIYVPLAQDTPGDVFLVVRPKSGRAGALASSVRSALARADQDQLTSVRSVMTLEDVAWEATGRHRFRAVLVMPFAGLALLLAAVGLFGILSYSVQQRVRDFGVRRALGATTSDVLRLVAGSAARVIAIGAALGLVSASVLSRLLTSLLFGVQPLDPATFAAVALVLPLSAAAAIAGPAWRASRVDPAVALRSD